MGWLLILFDLAIWGAYMAFPTAAGLLPEEEAGHSVSSHSVAVRGVHLCLRDDAFAGCHDVLVAGLSTFRGGEILDGRVCG